MEADPSLPGWGGWSAQPPSAGGGRAAIHPWMKFVALRPAKRQRSSHVRTTDKRHFIAHQ
jgi:hypothetical protein